MYTGVIFGVIFGIVAAVSKRLGMVEGCPNEQTCWLRLVGA